MDTPNAGVPCVAFYTSAGCDGQTWATGLARVRCANGRGFAASAMSNFGAGLKHSVAGLYLARTLVVAAGVRGKLSRKALRQQRLWAGRVGTANAGVPALASHERRL